jgi:hypothetical protein
MAVFVPQLGHLLHLSFHVPRNLNICDWTPTMLEVNKR